MARLYADENFPRPVVEALRRLGHDILTALEAGQAGQGIADDIVLSYGHARGRAVLTHNRKHFRGLHAAGNEHSGIIICTEDKDFAALAGRIDATLSTAGNLSGQMIRITRPRK